MKQKYKKFFFLIFFFLLSTPVILVLGATTEIGRDSRDDILCADAGDLIEFAESYDPDQEDPPTPEEILDLFNGTFDMYARPDYIDVLSWGITTNGNCYLYVEVENILDVPNCNSFFSGFFIIYNNTEDGEMGFFAGYWVNGSLDTQWYGYSDLQGNWDTTGNLSSFGNNYLLDYNCNWFPNADNGFFYGVLFSICLDPSGNITSICFDVFPNEYFNNWSGSDNEPFGSNDPNISGTGSNEGQGSSGNPLDMFSNPETQLQLWILFFVFLIAFIAIILVARSSPEAKS